MPTQFGHHTQEITYIHSSVLQGLEAVQRKVAWFVKNDNA